MSKNGLKVRSYFFELINLYELIGLGVLSDTLDEEMCKEFFKTIIVTNFDFLQDYIYHLRSQKHGKRTFGICFEWLYLKWK